MGAPCFSSVNVNCYKKKQQYQYVKQKITVHSKKQQNASTRAFDTIDYSILKLVLN